MADGTITIEIKGDNSDLASVLNEVTRTIDQVTRDWDQKTTQSANNAGKSGEKALEEIGATAEETGNAVYDVFNKVTGFLISKKVANAVMGFVEDSVALASALQEVQNVVDTTFGTRGANQIEQWANVATKSFGLSELQAKTYASTFGNIFKQMGVPEQRIAKMSTDLAGLAADMASFYNMNFDEAFNKIASSLNGQSRPLAGIVDMSVDALSRYAEGLDLVWSEMDAGEKSMLRYQYLMDSTKDVQGDFQKTSDSYANNIRAIQTSFDELKSMLGEFLLPAITAIAGGIRQFLGIFLPGGGEIEGQIKAITDSTNEEMDSVEDTADSARGLVRVLESLSESTQQTAEQHQVWLDTVNSLCEKLPGLRELIDQETGAIKGGTDGLKEYIDNWENASKIDIVKKAMEETAAVLGENEANLKKLRVEQEAYGKAMVDTGFSPERYATLQAKRAMQFGIFSPMEQAELDRLEAKKGEYEALAKEKERIDKQIIDYENAERAYQRLLDTYKEQVEAINAEDEAFANAEATGNAVAEGLEAALPSITEAADAIVAQINRVAVSERFLGYSRYGTGGGGGGGFDANRFIPGHASGLDYVPSNNYLAMLHAGEGVLTAEENRAWRNFKYGDRPADSSLAGAIAGSMGNMQIVWRGRVVADVLSDMQGDSYRALERSGWTS